MLKKAVISGIYGAYYKIIPDGSPDTELNARLRGKLRLKKNQTDFSGFRHLLTAGDHISFTSDGESEITIEDLFPRKNLLMRSSEFESHALGANLDRAVLVQSLVSPEPRAGFIDRFLASCHAGGVKPVIVFSKKDLAENENSPYLAMPGIYQNLSYSVFILNLISETGSPEMQEFIELCSEGVTLFAGNSGTGKSTLINRMFKRDIQKTGHISESTGKGRHTTTNSRLFLSENMNARYIDTPGVKEWGISHLTVNDVYASFPELSPYLSECKFKNCDHGEKASGCKVRDILNSADLHQIGPERLKSLNTLVESLQYAEKIRRGDYIKETGRIRSGKINRE